MCEIKRKIRLSKWNQITQRGLPGSKGRIGPSDWTVIPFLAISPSLLYLVGFSSSSQTNQSLINSLIHKRAESHLDSNWMQE